MTSERVGQGGNEELKALPAEVQQHQAFHFVSKSFLACLLPRDRGSKVNRNFAPARLCLPPPHAWEGATEGGPGYEPGCSSMAREAWRLETSRERLLVTRMIFDSSGPNLSLPEQNWRT